MPKFYKLQPGMDPELLAEVPDEAIRACPHLIMTPEHYRKEEQFSRCRCDDPDHDEMADWGYTWDDEKGRWT